ncbi:MULTISPECIES: glycoside hydrolase family 53 protein [Flavobacterium]|uniref:Arabinogalactan endo-beta-1,4-galactanase n=1 Tax=Flavobacterium algoritolerans TaxID=3041254 RepID=A0ABT6V7V9_9FLAO|nr:MULTISPECIES: glycosyl hydrolase 53 family protein [Flavobacterium]MDI5889285.1 glycosyl hydrolase 53 family protein [Flavobacterium yafengii]MDI5894314.1 glycosyl hydrolase 53 family protein [Flavobacterium algoritolerans]
MKKHILVFGVFALLGMFFSCSANDTNETPIVEPPVAEDTFIRAADISFLPEIESSGTILYNNTKAEDMLTTLKTAGCNAVRIRLWKNPSNGHSGMTEVKALAARVKKAGMKVWLTVHYSDTWADPAVQTIPAEWKNLSFTDLKTAVATYTSTIITEINPDIIQIGNEINSGLLWPQGHLINQEVQCLALLSAASTTIRTKAPNTKIMIHYAGVKASDTNWFFNKIKSVDYDYIGLSYYPIWHGKDLEVVKTTINTLGKTYNKKVIIAETAYPFTLGYNDWTNNIVGLDTQLVSGYPATPDGQKSFVMAIKTVVKESEFGLGFAYWGGEWISFKGNQAANGSTFENQAFYDFNNKALPVLQVFNK